MEPNLRWNALFTDRRGTNVNTTTKTSRNTHVDETIRRAAGRMKQWGITVTYLASQLGVSRQYAWQVMNMRTLVSAAKADQFSSAIESIITRQSHMQTFGDRLRAARISKGLKLKDVAGQIGYSWVGVERWEKNICRPKPGVLWHLRALYGVDENWLPPESAPGITLSPAHWNEEQRRVA